MFPKKKSHDVYLSEILSDILSEYSKNDPIPELNKKQRLAVILLGPPASGKTTFVNNFILRVNPSFKIFNSDDIIAMALKKYDSETSDKTGIITKHWELTREYIYKFIGSNSGNNFIYDATGRTSYIIDNIVKLCKQTNYAVIFIHVLTDLPSAIKQNISRERKVDNEYLTSVYEISQSLIKKYYNTHHPNAYYIVLNLNYKYDFFKYDNNKLLKRKNDKYVPLSENIEEVSIPYANDFWAWISPTNEMIVVPKLKHEEFIAKKYPDMRGYGWEALYDRAFKDGWIRAVFVKSSNQNTFALNGYSLHRLKKIFRDVFFDWFKSGNNRIVFQSDNPDVQKAFDTYDKDGREELLNFVL